MPKFVKIALLLLILIIVTVGGVLIGGYGQQVMIWGMSVFYAPDGPFNPAHAVVKPEYGDPAYWAALPAWS